MRVRERESEREQEREREKERNRVKEGEREIVEQLMSEQERMKRDKHNFNKHYFSR